MEGAAAHAEQHADPPDDDRPTQAELVEPLDIADERAEPPQEPQEPDVVDAAVEEEPGPAPDSPDAYKPSPEDLVVREPDDVYRAMDRADEELILDEIQGRALEVFVYDFGSGAQRKTDLSVKGVNEAIRLLNERGGSRIRISDRPPILDQFQEDGETFIRCLVYAEDTRGSHGAWGAATEPTHMKSGQKTVWDKFAATKALNKAERNAKKKLIPEDIVQTIIAMAREQDKVKVLRAAAAGDVPQLPPPLTDERATQIKNEARAAYDELKKLNRLRIPPARFNAYLVRAEYDHARLEEFRDAIIGAVEEEKAKVNA